LRACKESLTKRLYHGTSLKNYQLIKSGAASGHRVYISSNTSMGGTYLTTRLVIAKVNARLAAREHSESGAGVVLEIVPRGKLEPDEDWVVIAFKSLPIDGMERIKNFRMRGFFDDLFYEYDSFSSLSDHYKKRFDELNYAHGITFRDSLRWTGSLRQVLTLRDSQIKKSHTLKR